MTNLVKTVIKMAIGLAVGAIMNSITGSGSLIIWLLMGMGIPFGWGFINRHCPAVVGGSWIFLIIKYTFKFFFSVLIGWIIMPIELVRGILAIRAERALRKGE